MSFNVGQTSSPPPFPSDSVCAEKGRETEKKTGVYAVVYHQQWRVQWALCRWKRMQEMKEERQLGVKKRRELFHHMSDPRIATGWNQEEQHSL